MKVFHGDCRELLAEIETSSISMILTDPPYFLDGMGDDWDSSKLAKKTDAAKRIGGIPVGMKFDRKQGEKLRQFIFGVSDELRRVLKPGGFFLCFSQPRLVHGMMMGIEDAGFELRDLYAWKFNGQAKAFGMTHIIDNMSVLPDTRRQMKKEVGNRKTAQLRPMMEMIILAQNQRLYSLVPNFMEHHVGLVDFSNPVLEPDKFPGTIMECPKPRKRHHITEKPVDLCRHLIRLFSMEGQTVLDPFAGSGTTGVAAKMENRDFIGIEIDDTIVEIANKRLQNEG